MTYAIRDGVKGLERALNALCRQASAAIAGIIAGNVEKGRALGRIARGVVGADGP